MKKIFVSAIAILVFSAASAQTDRNSASKNTQPANDPLVNGIPYSQYKAQQQALKKSQQTNAVSPSLSVQPNVVAADGATPAATTPNVQVGQAPQEAKQPAKPAEKPKGQQ
ncbi:MAG: hypothetical protein U0T79_10115 [Ferruginibacter sp.]